MTYPTSPVETLADGTVHLIGLVFAIPASAILLMGAGEIPSLRTATAVYVACLVFAFATSALYHLLPFERTRPVLGRIDHAAIYFKIAGSYTPVVVLIGTGFAYGILGLVWVLAIVGALAKLWFWRLDGKGSLALYLGMGWLSILLIWPMWHTLPGATIALIVIGGAVYSAGTLIYAHPGMRFQNAIWHIFVLVASVCLFAAIALAIQTTAAL